ncbi:MAG: tetratricopeptide repeat protein [Myxococcota bacterium]
MKRLLPCLLLMSAACTTGTDKRADAHPTPPPAAPDAGAPQQDFLTPAQAALTAGEHARARELLRSAAAQPGAGALPFILLAESHLSDDGDLVASEKALTEALTREPQNGRALFLMARVRETQGRGAEAEELYVKSVTGNPPQPDAHERIGSLALWQAALARRAGDEDGAVRAYARAVSALEAARAASGDKPAYALGEAQAREGLGDVAGAEAALKRLVALSPEATEPHARLADFYERHGEPEKARKERELSGVAAPRKLRPLKPSR